MFVCSIRTQVKTCYNISSRKLYNYRLYVLWWYQQYTGNISVTESTVFWTTHLYLQLLSVMLKCHFQPFHQRWKVWQILNSVLLISSRKSRKKKHVLVYLVGKASYNGCPIWKYCVGFTWTQIGCKPGVFIVGGSTTYILFMTVKFHTL